MKALISVSDKTRIVEFAKELEKLDIDIISTGGTAKLLEKNKVKVTEISEYTGSPEIMDGRVKTLHPKVHGGLLCMRDNPDHKKQAEENNIEMIDIVVVNLYPFKATIEKPDVKIEEAIENIDIGGPTMLRSAAKNHKYVTVITDPEDYQLVLEELTNGNTTEETRQKLAVKVFRHTADYDSMIDTYLSKNLANESILRLKFIDGKELRYGENWHQQATFYKKEDVEESSLANAEILHGKDMSFNNYVDANAAFEVVKEFRGQTAVSIIKHTNPCGLATGKTVRQAFEAAWQGDPISAFGSIIACTTTIDLEAAEFLKGKFVEAIIAPDFKEDALDFLKNKSKDIRIIKIPKIGEPTEKTSYKHIVGGMLEQSRDIESFQDWKLATKNEFPKNKEDLAKFIWLASKHTKSNAIMLGYEYEKGHYMVLGMGAGQPNRIDALRKLAVTKARENLEIMAKDQCKDLIEFIKEKMSECVLASDAFFPFDDSVREAAEHNIKFIVQPGGSKRDEDVIKACDELGTAMIFTGMRHFNH